MTAHIILTPNTGKPGSTVTVTGQGWPINATIQLQIDNKTVGTAIVGGTGIFTKQITLPNREGDIIVRTAMVNAAAAKFTSSTPPAQTGTRLIMWTGGWDMTDNDLDEFHAMGIGGFVVGMDHLVGQGGAWNWTTQWPPNNVNQYGLESALIGSDLINRCKQRGMQVWVGVRLSSVGLPSALPDYWNDTAWVSLCNELGNLAAALRMLGAAGIAFDEEPDRSGTWDWNYPGNTYDELTTRSAVSQRGTQMMHAMTITFPGISILDYQAKWDGGLDWHYQHDLNHDPAPYKDNIQRDMWVGLLSAGGYSEVVFLDSSFYKGVQLSGVTPERACDINKNEIIPWLNTRVALQNKVFITPFVWVDGNVAGGEEGPLTPDVAAWLLAHCANGAMGHTLGIYCYAGAAHFDFTPYAAGILAASKVTALG